MKKTLKRVTSFLLVLVMLLGMLPAIGVTMVSAASATTGDINEIYCSGGKKLYIRGWAYDPDSSSASVEIHVYVYQNGSQVYGTNAGATSVYRSEVNSAFGISGNHGFELTLTLPVTGNVTVNVYAIDKTGDANTLLQKSGNGSPSVYIRLTDADVYGQDNWNLSEDDVCSDKPDGIYRITAAANPGYCLDISGGSESNGGNLQLWTNNTVDNQLFHLRRINYSDLGNGIYQTGTIVGFMNIRSQLFLDKDSGSTNVHQYDDTPNNSHRHWAMKNNGDGTYSFESVASPGYYMTIEGGTVTNGANIGVAAPNSDGTPTLYQRFYLNAEYPYNTRWGSSVTGILKTGEYRIWGTSDSTYTESYLLDVSGAGTANNTNIQVWSDGDAYTLQQIFDIQKDGEGWYTIRNFNSGLYVNAYGAAAGKKGTNIIQYNDTSDGSKWAFIPNLRSDGSLSYWIVNKATGLYMFRAGMEDGKNVYLTSNNNNEFHDSSWLAWGTQAFYGAATVGTVTNDATGIVPDSYDGSDTISLPIKIYDYPNDGLLFEYSEDGTGDNRSFDMLRNSRNDDYTSWAIGRINYGAGAYDDSAAYFTGSVWTSSPDGYNNIYQINHEYVADAYNGGTLDLNYLSGSDYLGYSVYGEMKQGMSTMGLIKPTIREVDGHKLLEYNDEVVAYIADLLEKTLRNRESYWTTWQSEGIDIPIGTKEYLTEMGFTDDLAGLLLSRMQAGNGGTAPTYSDDQTTRNSQIYNHLVQTMAKADNLIGTWSECQGYITTYTDAAYFILNNLFYPESYNMPQDKFDYLVLSRAELTNGKSAYVFDSGFSDTYDYVSGTTSSAIEYDFDAKTISNSSMEGKPGYRFLEYYTMANYAFLPVWETQSTQQETINPYQDTNNGNSSDASDYANKNFNYVLQCNGVFTYDENEALFFDFAGDDDVYLFINDQLVLDIGGAHSVTIVEMNLNDYVYAARAAVAAGSTDPRDLALALENGKEYSFDFYYMERHGYGSNMRVATNIRVSDPNLDTSKKAYQNGQELNYGGLVNADENVEYSFKLANPENSIADLYRLTFSDAKLGLTMDSTNGLVVTGNKTVNSAGTALTAADLQIYFTNQKGVTQEISLSGSTAAEKNEALKTYLKQVNGDGLLPGCSIEIRGIYYNIADSDFVSGRFTNTLQVTANQKADGSGNTYQDSVNMVVCMASGPQYYQWSGNTLTVSKTDFAADVNELLTEGSALLEQIAPATSLGTISNMQLCDMSGNVTYSNYVSVSASGISIAYNTPGAYVFYVKVTQSDNSVILVPVQACVVNVEDSVFVLDYGLKADLGQFLTEKDTLGVPGHSTSYKFEAVTSNTPSYGSNKMTFIGAAQSVNGTYGDFVVTDDNSIEYRPDEFMNGADSVYAAVRVYEGTPSSAIGTVDINTEVEMFKKITVLPANVVYYEDDFPAIKYYDSGSGKTANTVTADGNGSGAIYQSADQSLQYGFDNAYESGTMQSGNSGHVIRILDANVAAEFTFAGTGFELIGRAKDADNCVLYLDVFDSSQNLVKRIPVILEYDDMDVTNGQEGIYQVPVVRVSDLAHGTYTVQIHGVPPYTATNTPPTLYIDGIRVYNPLAMTDSNRDHYIDGEDTAEFLEIRDLILKGKAAAIEYNSDSMTLGTGTSTFTENRNGETYPVNTFVLNSIAYSGYFADAPTSADVQGKPLLGLYSQSKMQGNHQLVFTFAKTVNGTDYYYIHINSGGTERYLKKSTTGAEIMLISAQWQEPSVTDPDCFLWKINYLDDVKGIVTIQSKSDNSYLSVSSVDTTQKTGTIQAVETATVTDAQKWELAGIESTEVFEGNEVNSINDYLAFGPNNELYLDGVSLNQALVFYFNPDGDAATTTMLQVGVRVLNDNLLNGVDDELSEVGILYQSANTETPGWKIIDDNISTATERYYPIDLNLCRYDEKNNRYEVVLYCAGGYISFTNLKISGGSIQSINGETADLRYNNGVLEMLTAVGTEGKRSWMPVANSGNYPDFASLTEQMGATMIYEVDMDTGEFVPAESDSTDKIALAGRSLLFKDIIKMRFYFDISNSGVTTATDENSGLLTWTEEEYAALNSYTAETAGAQIKGLSYSANGYYADTQGIPAKNMVDKLYVRAYVILPDGSYEYSEMTEFSPVMYAQLVLESETTTATMKDLVVALMNYGTAAQFYFGYKTETPMNAWMSDELKSIDWDDKLMNLLPTDTSKYTYTANKSIVKRGSSVTFSGAINLNFYFSIPTSLTKNASTVELLYWTESDYEELDELTVENARKLSVDMTNGRVVLEGTTARNLGNAVCFAVHIANEDGDVFSQLYVDSAHDYARRVLASNTISDDMKTLAKALVVYTCKAKAQLGG